MSSGLNCEFYHITHKGWYYLLQDWTCPIGAWDWREYATAYGPFRSETLAKEHLMEHHANPGSWVNADDHTVALEDLDFTVQQQLHNATR